MSRVFLPVLSCERPGAGRCPFWTVRPFSSGKEIYPNLLEIISFINCFSSSKRLSVFISTRRMRLFPISRSQSDNTLRVIRNSFIVNFFVLYNSPLAGVIQMNVSGYNIRICFAMYNIISSLLQLPGYSPAAERATHTDKNFQRPVQSRSWRNQSLINYN